MRYYFLSIIFLIFISPCTATELSNQYSRIVKIYSSNGFGQGVMIDNRRILTAAHVVDNNPSEAFSVQNNRNIIYSATLTKIGDRSDIDLAVLTLKDDAMPNITEIGLCSKEAQPGDELTVMFDNKSQQTYAAYSGITYFKGEKYSESTEGFFSHGVSGSPVFQENSGCLTGIISHFEYSSATSTGCIKDDLSGKLPYGSTCAATFGTKFVGTTKIHSFLLEP